MKKLISLVVILLGLSSTTIAAESAAVKVLVLKADNLLVLNGEVDSESVGELMIKMRQLNKPSLLSSLKSKAGLSKPDRIVLFVDTPGGEIQSGLLLNEALKASDRPVDTVTSFAASMGWQLVQGLGTRYVLKNGVLMSHRAAGELGGSFGGKEPSQFSNRMNLWLERLKEMDEQTVSRTHGKQTLASYREQYDQELWVTGSQAVQRGYADEVVIVKCDESLEGVNHHKLMLFGIIPVKYDTDKCPLNNAPMNIEIDIPTTEKKDDKKEASKEPAKEPAKEPKKNGYMELEEFISKGGQFGAACLYGNTGNLCAADPSLSLEKIRQAIEELKGKITNKKDHVVRMHF